MEKHINNTKKDNQTKEKGLDDLLVELAGIMLVGDKMLGHMMDDEEEEENLPNAAPLDLLSKNDYEEMDAYLERKYGPLREYIDENYVALLIALREYEKVDLDAKISAHIAASIGQ